MVFISTLQNFSGIINHFIKVPRKERITVEIIMNKLIAIMTLAVVLMPAAVLGKSLEAEFMLELRSALDAKYTDFHEDFPGGRYHLGSQQFFLDRSLILPTASRDDREIQNDYSMDEIIQMMLMFAQLDMEASAFYDVLNKFRAKDKEATDRIIQSNTMLSNAYRVSTAYIAAIFHHEQDGVRLKSIASKNMKLRRMDLLLTKSTDEIVRLMNKWGHRFQ